MLSIFVVVAILDIARRTLSKQMKEKKWGWGSKTQRKAGVRFRIRTSEFRIV